MLLHLSKNILLKLREVILHMNLQLINNTVLVLSQFNIYHKNNIIHQTTKQVNSLSNNINSSKTNYYLKKYHLRT